MPVLTIEFTEDLQVGRISGFPLHRAGALGLLAVAARAINDHLDAEEKKVVKPASEADMPPAGRMRHLNGGA